MDITTPGGAKQSQIPIFFCYAREDELLLNQLKNHLQPLQRQGLIELWYDREIQAGSEWGPEIKKRLDVAQIILLLVSPDFMASDYCYNVEMQHALERHQRGEATVIPIILRDVFWHGDPLGRLQALPTDGKPVTNRAWASQDEAFYTIVMGIRDAVETRLENSDRISKGLNKTRMNPEKAKDSLHDMEKEKWQRIKKEQVSSQMPSSFQRKYTPQQPLPQINVFLPEQSKSGVASHGSSIVEGEPKSLVLPLRLRRRFFGEVLKQERLRHGWTLGEMGEKMGISGNALAKWERGQNIPDDPIIIQNLCSLLGEMPGELGLQGSQPLSYSVCHHPQTLPIFFGEVLKQERLRHGWTLGEVAKKLAINESTLVKWEQGQKIPHDTLTVHNLCLLLGKTSGELGLEKPSY